MKSEEYQAFEHVVLVAKEANMGAINARTARALFTSDLDYVLTETGELALLMQCTLQEAGREAARYSEEHDA